MPNFYFNGLSLEFGTPSERFDRNVEVIRLVKSLDGKEATPEQQAILASYIGWGDTRVNRYLDYRDRFDRSLVTDEELRAIRASTLNAHYTDLPVVDAMWGALLKLGIGNLRWLRILDPSAGVGHFQSMQPQELRDISDWTEIELDSLTYQILKALHPNNRVINDGFENVNLPDGMFDLGISNIPFGNYGVHSKRDMPKIAKKSIHNFFLCNTWALLKPGGIMAYITSRFTMDKKDPIIRKWLAERFDLLDAVRLPHNAFKENAGTEVVTDILILQKRDLRTVNDDWQGPGNWIAVEETRRFHEYRVATINKYFIEHPEKVMGKQEMTSTMYQSDGYNVTIDDDQDLRVMLKEHYSNLAPIDWDYWKSKRRESFEANKPSSEVIKVEKEEGSPVVVALMDIFYTAKQLIRAETNGDANTEILRGLLNDKYDTFYSKYGTITANVGKVKGAESFFLRALEKEEVVGIFRKADIFNRSITRKLAQLTSATTGDALLLCLDTLGKVDIEFVAKYVGKDEKDVIEELGESIFRNPVTQEWETAEEYLSGNVRQKLREAQAAAEYDDQYERNVQAVEAVIPATVEAGSIRAPLGAGWIPEKYVTQFVVHLLGGGQYEVKYIEKLATWQVNVRQWYGIDRSRLAVQFGTSRMNALELLDFGLNSRTPLVYDGSNEDRVLNTKETVAAQAKLQEIKDEFEKWLWTDTDRANDLVHLYNEAYNSVRVANYSGAHLSTPGLNADIKLRSNQKDAAWRIIQTTSTMIGHEVGMGKTLTAIVAVMESKRLGFTKKAMIVVPNHLIPNWQNALQISYPGANLLLPEPSDLTTKNRSKFMSTIATNEWDIVLVPFSSFKLLPVSPERVRDFYVEQLAELEEALAEAKEDGSHTSRKEIEKSIKRLKAKLENLGDMKKDDASSITWEELGIDMLIVDEFHAFKNLFFTTKMTRVAGLSNSESQRAFDMFIKFRWLVENNAKIVGMTGTPVTNTIAEMFTMQRYFQLLTLKESGIVMFDAWVRQFALAEPGLEMTPDGSGFRMNTRFRKFVNVPEMMQMWLNVADMRRIEGSTEIERPALWRGKPVKVVSSAGAPLENYVKELASRAEKIRAGMIEPTKDNMLKVTSDGRKAALDLSLVIPAAPGAPMPKIDDMADIVAKIWELTKQVKGSQLIFCDLGTPKAKAAPKKETDEVSETEEVLTEEETRLTSNVYAEIKMRLMKRGIPMDEIAFIHDAKNGKQKAALEAKVNAGEVRVLVGSNEKMGTGLNVQERLLAIHQITPPWRPGDIEQQVGRMWRQGNRFPQVFQFVHVTESSFDGYIWQLLENKAGFIGQIAKGQVVDREMEDIGEAVLTFSEIKGLASGNPKVMQKIVLDSEEFRLRSVYASWKSSLFALRSDLKYKQYLVDDNARAITAFKEAIAIRDANTTEGFEIELKEVFGDGALVKVTDKAEAGRRILQLAEQAAQRVLSSRQEGFMIGRYKGHVLSATAQALEFGKGEKLEDAIYQIYFTINGKRLPVQGDQRGIITSINAVLRLLSDKLEKLEAENAHFIANLASMEAELQKPWELQAKYDKLLAELAEINKELEGSGEKQPEAEDNRTEEEKEEDMVAKAMDRKDAFAKAHGVKDVEEAYAAIEEMMSLPETLQRFRVIEQVIPVTEESVFVPHVEIPDVGISVVIEPDNFFADFSLDDIKEAVDSQFSQLSLF